MNQKVTERSRAVRSEILRAAVICVTPLVALAGLSFAVKASFFSGLRGGDTVPYMQNAQVMYVKRCEYESLFNDYHVLIGPAHGDSASAGSAQCPPVYADAKKMELR